MSSSVGQSQVLAMEAEHAASQPASSTLKRVKNVQEGKCARAPLPCGTWPRRGQIPASGVRIGGRRAGDVPFIVN